MSMPVVLRSTFDAAKAKAAEVEAELHREMTTVRETLERAREDHEAALADRDRVAGALARASAEADRFAATIADQKAELARAAEALEAQRHDAKLALSTERAAREDAQSQADREAKGREDAQMALADAQGRLEQTSRRLEDFRSETERLGAQLAQVQAVHRADVEALARTASERDRFAARLEDFSREAERLGQQVLGVIAQNSSLEREVNRLDAENTSFAHRLRALAPQSRQPNASAHDAEKSYFAVFSLGRTATQWQVSGLNRHPLVHVTHAWDLSQSKREPASQGEDFLRSLARQSAVRERVSDIDSAFDLIESSAYRVFGNIHGVDVLPAFEHPDLLRRSYVTFYQTRHPITRLRSIVDRWKYEASLDSSRQQLLRDDADRAFDHAPPRGADLGKEDDWLFAYAISYLLGAESRYLQSSAPIVLFERLISDRDHFGWYVRQLMGNAVEVDEAMIDDFHATAPIDKRGASPLAAKAVHASWEDWQRAYFAQALEQAGTRAHYAALGYEVSF